ncbi:MAG: class I SAM-dependent methyltransferase [Nocardioides sp.]
MNPLEEYFRDNDSRLIHKWMHYFDVYHRHFERFRGRPVVVLEFGVNQGGSLEMWRDYFGPDAKIFGVDIDPRCREFEDENIRILIGDQADKEFLQQVVAEIGEPIDVVIEDGGHRMRQQKMTFRHIYPHLSDDGCFLTEDTHTSYWQGYGGGFRRRTTFMEFAKNKIDQLNAWHSKTDDLEVDDFTRSTDSIHFYDSIVVFERSRRSKPEHRITGHATFRDFPDRWRLDAD